MEFKGQKINLIETSVVKEGVVCDVYEFEDDVTKDLGIVKVIKGNKTPLQKVLSGDKTLEIFESGVGTLTVVDTKGETQTYSFPSGSKEVEVKVGETMQWEAIENLTFIEVCYPPYKDGRYENLES